MMVLFEEGQIEMRPILRPRLLIALLLPALALGGCGAREKEAAAKEIERCRGQIKNIPDATQREMKQRSCAKLEFDFRQKYDSQPDPR
jgi:hypothetical protein